MAQISFDNGRTYHDASDADELRDGIALIGWDVIVNAMDDDARERCHMESDATDEAEWLADYLRMADDDLIIG